MLLCSDGHDEVCYESNPCPVCSEQSRVKTLEGQVEDLNTALKSVEEERDDFDGQNAGLQSDLAAARAEIASLKQSSLGG